MPHPTSAARSVFGRWGGSRSHGVRTGHFVPSPAVFWVKAPPDGYRWSPTSAAYIATGTGGRDTSKGDTFRSPDPSMTLAPTLLLADDDDLVRASLRAGLTEAGFAVVSTAESPRALAMFRAEPDLFVCAVLDVMMPALGGLELVRELRRIRADLPVVLVTAHELEPAAMANLERLRTRILAKPSPIAAIVRAIDELRAVGEADADAS